MEEQVIQETPVASPEQPVAATETPAVDSSVYEQQIKAEKARAEEAEGKFQRIKDKMNALDEKMRSERQKTLEDQGQWKPLWEEANKTGQEKDQRIGELERQISDLRSSNETATMKTAALSAISQAGAVKYCNLFRAI